MSEKLIKFNLNPEAAEKYIHSNLEGCNILCKSILIYTDFKKGSFFTFLKKGLSYQHVNAFGNGNVGKKVKETLSNWLVTEYENQREFTIILDADDLKYEEEKNTNLFARFGINQENDVFYFLSEDALKEELEQIAKNAEIILVLAYDQEGYIIWKRNGS